MGGGAEVDEFVGGTVEANYPAAHDVPNLVAEFVVWEDIKAGDIGKKRSYVCVEYLDARVCGKKPERAGKGIGAFDEAVICLLEDINRVDPVSHQNAQVNGFRGEGEGSAVHRV